MKFPMAAVLIAGLTACASGAGSIPEGGTETLDPWKEMAERHPGRFAPRLYVAYDSVAQQNWGEFERLSRSLEEQTESEEGLVGPVGTLFLAAGRTAPTGRSTGYLEKARRLLEKAGQKPGDATGLSYNLGLACFLLRDFPASSTALQQSMEREPGNSAAANLLVRSLLEQGEPANAMGWIEKAHGALKPAERQELMALCHYMMGQHAEAIRAYEAALESDSKSPRLWNNLGLCYEESRQPDKARECFAKAASLRAAPAENR